MDTTLNEVSLNHDAADVLAAGRDRSQRQPESAPKIVELSELQLALVGGGLGIGLTY
jgi:hypothetical protein